MFGFVWLTPLFLIGLAGLLYFLDMAHVLSKIPLANYFSGRVEKNTTYTIIAAIAVVFGFGIIGVDAVTDYELPTANAAEQYGADIVLIFNDGSGSAFADTGYTFYPLDYSTYAGSSAYEIVEEIKDFGTGNLVGPEGETAVAETISSGKITIDDYIGSVGDKMVIFGYDDTTPAAGDYEAFFTVVEIVGYNAEQGTFTVTPNKHTLNTFGTIDTYNFAGTDIAGYQEDEDAAKTGMSIDFDVYANADYNISSDAGLYIELPSGLQSNVNKIKVSTTDGVFAEYTSFLDTSNMDTSNAIFESAPSKQSSSNNLYYVGALPDAYRTSSTNLDEINIEVNYDHPGTGTNVAYIYVVEQVSGGADLHFDIAANPAFALNATASGTDGWQT